MALIAPRTLDTSLPRVSLRRPARTLTLVSLLTVFLVLAADALVHGRSFFDLPLLRAVQRVDLPLLEQVVRPVDRLTSGPGAVLAWTVLLATLLLARWWIAALAVAVLPVGGVINETVGHLTRHVRPSAAEVDRYVTTTAPSFPSGHVAGAVLLYGLLFVIADRIERRPLRLALKAGSLAVIAVSAFGRLWLGAHWPSDVLGALALGGLLLLPLVALYRRLDASLRHVPLVRAAQPEHEESGVHAHALTSLVLFEGDRVRKVYAPGLLPRALYAAAFQAEFPYLRNDAALDAAKHRRNLAALLSEYWYGAPRVARVLAIERIGAARAITSERIEGHAPADRAAAKAWLRDLRSRFEEAGLPTWQIDPRQPRAVDNVLETADGRYMIVDLESGLVAPIASLRTWGRGLRRGLLPLYDDVYFDITRAYVAREEAAMRAARGDAWTEHLLATLAQAEAAALAWHRSEPRLIGRLLRGVQRGFGVLRRPAAARSALSGSQEKAQLWLARAIDRWEAEGRVSAAEAATMRAHMNGDEFQAMLPHLGAHIVISILLRFPFGSIARAGWSLGALLTASGRLLTRRIDRAAWKQAWSIHSPLVILLAAVPGFGSFAYLAAKPIRSNRLLLRATADAALAKAPWRLYERSRLRRIVARPAGVAAAVDGGTGRVGGRSAAEVEVGTAGAWLVPAPGFVAAMAERTADAPAGRPLLRVIPGRGDGHTLPGRRGGRAAGEPARQPAA